MSTGEDRLAKLGADDALAQFPGMDPWNGEIGSAELLAAKREAHVIMEAERIRVREDARALVTAERAGGVAGLPEPLTLAQSLLLPSEYPEKWRIDGMLPFGGNASLTAVRKIGKTVTSTNLIRSLVDGDPFLGQFEVSAVSGNVAISNYEVSREQLDEWLSHQTIAHPENVIQFPFRGHRVPLMTDEGTEWMAKRLRDHDCEVWIVDPFSAAYNAAGGLQENDNSEVRRFLERLNEIKREAGVSEIVLTVHGSRGQQEGSERSRAASALEDWPDALWQLNKAKDDEDSRFFKVAAGRDVTEGEYRLELDVMTNRLTVAGGSRKESRLEPLCDDIVEYVGKNPGATNSAIVDQMYKNQDHNRNDSREAVKLAIVRKLIRTEDGPRRAVLHYVTENESASAPESASSAPARSRQKEHASVSAPVRRVNGPAHSRSLPTKNEEENKTPVDLTHCWGNCGLQVPTGEGFCTECREKYMG